MWSLNYALPPDMAMVGLRDVLVVAPPPTFNPNLISDHHSLSVAVDHDNLLTHRSNRGAGIHLLQQNQQSTNHNLHNAAVTSDLIGGGIGGGLASSSSAATATCQDCGNQAKKDCSHRRCRTCCRSRGLDCSTHVKSTWVPAARRRERQLMAVNANAAAAAGSSGSTSGAKKQRLIASQTTSHTSTSNTTPPRSLDISSSHQDAAFRDSLPGQVRAPAVFKCVRVTAVDDGDDEYAYQAVVRIGGHVFKGFLYDQGIQSEDQFPDVSELHLGDGGGGGGGGSRTIVDHVAASGGGMPGFLGGLNYGNHIS